MILRKPTPAAFCGSFVFVGTPDEVIGMRATAKSGHSVLERELRRVKVGDRVVITYFGKRPALGGSYLYRHYEVDRL